MPDSTIRPSTSTTARSASSTVESRCVATSTVRPCERGAEALDEPTLRERVDGGERIVEHDDARPRDERARERDALALPAGQVDAALADQRVVAVRQVVGERVDAGGLARREHLVPVGVLAAGGEVLAQRHREEHRPLRHERDGGAKLGDRHVARVDAADAHVAAGRVVETRQQIEQRRLARAGRAADRDDLARLDDEVEPAQHVRLAAVGEVHGLEAHGERAGRQRASGAVGSGSGSIPSSQAKLRPADASARWAEVRDPAERLERPDELEQQRLEEHELADRERARDHLAAAEEDDGGDRERRQVVEPGEVRRLDAGLPQHGVAHRLRPCSPKRPRTSASRPNACTISMPTTASSAASVTSPLRSCTWRESGETRRAKRSASTVIGGIATAV